MSCGEGALFVLDFSCGMKVRCLHLGVQAPCLLKWHGSFDRGQSRGIYDQLNLPPLLTTLRLLARHMRHKARQAWEALHTMKNVQSLLSSAARGWCSPPLKVLRKTGVTRAPGPPLRQHAYLELQYESNLSQIGTGMEQVFSRKTGIKKCSFCPLSHYVL